MREWMACQRADIPEVVPPVGAAAFNHHVVTAHQWGITEAQSKLAECWEEGIPDTVNWLDWHVLEQYEESEEESVIGSLTKYFLIDLILLGECGELAGEPNILS